jgi:hypothetical protein
MIDGVFQELMLQNKNKKETPKTANIYLPPISSKKNLNVINVHRRASLIKTRKSDRSL